MVPAEGAKKTPLYISLQANVIGEKKNKQTNKMSSVVLYDPLVFSSRLGLAVVFGVIFRSGQAITTFLLAFKNRKFMVLIKTFIFFNS